MSDISISESIDKYYEVTSEVLGNGFFATVRVGINKKTGEKVAVKIIDKSKVEESPQLLQNEIDIMRKVDHPNVIALRDVFDSEERLFIVMELVTGGELYERIVEKKTFSEKDASSVMKQIASALAYLHDIGIVHRDLKLENILIKNKGGNEIKIADFGLSKIYSGGALQTACGTPFYVAPDILLGDGYGPAVDMWASGVLLYVLLSGRLPFHADNDPALFRLILDGKLVFKSPQFDSVSKNATDLIKKLLNSDPEIRLTAKQVLEHPFIVEYEKNDEKPLQNHMSEKLSQDSFHNARQVTQEKKKKGK